MPAFQDERTEPATPKRRQEARKKGNVPKTRELSSALLILSLGVLFYFHGSSFNSSLMKMFGYYWNNFPSSVSSSAIMSLMLNAEQYFLKMMIPVFVTFGTVSLFSHLIQTGFICSTQAIVPELSRISPLNGIKRLFSLSSLVELLKSVIKLFIIGYVSYKVLTPEAVKLSSLVSAPAYQIFLYTSRLCFKLLMSCGMALLVMSLLDYLFQRYQHEQNLRMTKQEVKEEMKEREGDPKIKARIRSLQRQLAMGRMMQEVPKADVVITNPTKIAVALRYDSKTMYAPKVVAKGYGFVASKIKEIARRYGVPVLENKWLARMLVKVEVGEYIPAKLYRAVAEILAYIYRLREGYQYHEVA
jgi:flagellar biosynthetic protein FlhB